jgi:hypothetical protein
MPTWADSAKAFLKAAAYGAFGDRPGVAAGGARVAARVAFTEQVSFEKSEKPLK